MPRPSKSINSVAGHRTKAEKSLRENAEKGLKTGAKMKEFLEVKNDPVAHSQFVRVRKLLKANDKDDDMYSAVVNRYCLLYSECKKYEVLKDAYSSSIEELSADKELVVEGYATSCADAVSLTTYYKMKNNFSKAIISLDAAIMSKRKMMFDIEKENLMTVASGLRSIPKKPVEIEEDPVLKALRDDD